MSNAASSLMTGLRLNSWARRTAYSEVRTRNERKSHERRLYRLEYRGHTKPHPPFQPPASSVEAYLKHKGNENLQCCHTKWGPPSGTLRILARFPTDTVLGIKTSTCVLFRVFSLPFGFEICVAGVSRS